MGFELEFENHNAQIHDVVKFSMLVYIGVIGDLKELGSQQALSKCLKTLYYWEKMFIYVYGQTLPKEFVSQSKFMHTNSSATNSITIILNKSNR